MNEIIDFPEVAEDKTPHDYNAEYQLIGWVLCKPELINHIFLASKVFYYGFHAEIWNCINKLSKEGKAISPFTIMPMLKVSEAWAVQSDNVYLAQSVTASLLMIDPIEGAKYLEELYKKRQLYQAISAISSDDSLEVNAGKLSRAMSAITSESLTSEFEDNLMVSDQIIKDLQSKKLPFTTGLKKLDTAMDGGLYSGKSYGFAARKKVGKTAYAATISSNLNMAGVKHLFICGEMSPKEIHQRVLARAAAIFPTAFRTEYGQSDNCNRKLMDAINQMPRNTLYKNAPGLTFDALRQICTIAVEKHKIKGFILDYWQLVGGKEKNKSTAEHLDEVAQWIADFARTYDIWTITMAQINQDGNTRGGEGIRLAFDQLYQIHRENLTGGDSWIEMMETRYTPWVNIGAKEKPGMMMMDKGPYFEEI